MWWKIVLISAIALASCKSNEGVKNTLSTLDSNAANKPSVILSDQLVVQTFSQLPPGLEACNGLFVRNIDSANAAPQYVFVSNLKGIAYIRVNDRLMEMRLVRQTNIDKFTVNELYANEELELDLKIKQMNGEGEESMSYQGVLILRKSGKREVVNIRGKIGCQ